MVDQLIVDWGLWGITETGYLNSTEDDVLYIVGPLHSEMHKTGLTPPVTTVVGRPGLCLLDLKGFP